MTTAFALEGRVRPFNKWLRYDLEREPLAFDGLLRPDRIVSAATPIAGRPARRCSATSKRLARARGHGAVVDSWEPNVALAPGRGQRLAPRNDQPAASSGTPAAQASNSRRSGASVGLVGERDVEAAPVDRPQLRQRQPDPLDRADVFLGQA